MGKRTKPSFAYLDSGRYPIAFAHRGGNAAGANIENTMRAFRSAYELGFRYMETDVILSADGKVVAIHGAKNKKDEAKTGLPLRSVLQALDYEQIKQKYKIGGEDIPLLGDLFDEFDDIKVNIDPKTNEVVRPLGKLLLERGLQDRVGIGSSSYNRTKGVAEILGGQDKVCTALGPLGAAALKTGILVPGYLASTDAACLQLPYQHVTARMVGRASEQDLDVHVWTVNNPPDIYQALENGVDGVMSDNLHGLKSVLSAKRAWPEVN